MSEQIEIKDWPTDFMIRYDSNTSLYCDIAMEAFYDAMQLYDAMKAAKWFLDSSTDMRMPERMRKKAITAVVFSAMSAEAFINEYLAVRIGDDLFFEKFHNSKYHYYDKLDMIMWPILKQWNHKQLAWYWDVCKMFEMRNGYVHSASREMTARQLIDNQYFDEEQKKLAEDRLEAACETFSDDPRAQIYAVMHLEESEDVEESCGYKIADRAEREELKKDLGNASFALTALSTMMRAIEKLDPISRAFTFTFSPISMLIGEENEVEIRKTVFKKIGLNFTEEERKRMFLET